jgi:hypothetical protein
VGKVFIKFGLSLNSRLNLKENLCLYSAMPIGYYTQLKYKTKKDQRRQVFICPEVSGK